MEHRGTHLHFANKDNYSSNKIDKLRKTRPLHDATRKAFAEVCQLSDDINIDDVLMRLLGRFNFET